MGERMKPGDFYMLRINDQIIWEGKNATPLTINCLQVAKHGIKLIRFNEIRHVDGSKYEFDEHCNEWELVE